jgi:hypothetical protein
MTIHRLPPPAKGPRPVPPFTPTHREETVHEPYDGAHVPTFELTRRHRALALQLYMQQLRIALQTASQTLAQMGAMGAPRAQIEEARAGFGVTCDADAIAYDSIQQAGAFLRQCERAGLIVPVKFRTTRRKSSKRKAKTSR